MTNKLLDKNKLRAQQMLNNEKEEFKKHQQQQIKDYTEGKIIKGWSKEQSLTMAKKLILNQ